MAVLGAVVIAALSTLVVAPAPSYDPWSWLQWGREIAGGELHTAEGPAFKPLPVAVCALLSFLGDAAPWLWVTIARAGALLALLLSFQLGSRLAGGSFVAGAVAVAGVALCGNYLDLVSAGIISGWLLALALAGLEAWRAGRIGLALACAVACGLLQVEAWPFLALLGAVAWRRRDVDRRAIAAAALAVPALWFIPEWLGSGDLLRSAERARVPNPGQPALADVPAIESIEQAAPLLLWPLWLGVAALVTVAWRRPGTSRQALLPAAVGLTWVAIVAGMAQIVGFSGEPRYALPGMALIAISGAVGLVSAGRPPTRPPTALLLAAVLGLVALAAVPRIENVVKLRDAQAYQWQLSTDLADAIDAAGGRDAVLRCGTAFVGPHRGPLMAYQLDVPKQTVEPDLPPEPPGTVFRSRRAASVRVEPETIRGFDPLTRTKRWQVAQACRVRLP